MKRKLYIFILNMMLADKETLGLTGKQKCHIENLINKCK